MILQASNGCYLTENKEIPMKERHFVKNTHIANTEAVKGWKEITEKEMDEMVARSAVVDVDDMSYDSLGAIDALLADVSMNINNIGLTANQALEKKMYFPEWGTLVGTLVGVGFRLRMDGTLYEVVQEHTIQADWKPGQGTESLYKVVQVEHDGTLGDPIPWEHGMELFAGKYYTDKDVLYECIRDSGMGLSFDLADLVSGGYVTVYEEGIIE